MPLAEAVRLLEAVSEPNRLRILAVLYDGRMCVCELCAALGLKQSVMSQHLRVLRDRGLVEHRKDGLWVDYELAPAALRGTKGRILRSLLREVEQDESVRRDRREASKVDRMGLCRRRGAPSASR